MFISALRSDPETLKTFRKMIFRSTAYAISAYYITYILEKGLIVCGALLKGFTVDLKYNHTRVLAEYQYWDQETVLLIYLIPFFLQALVLIFFYIRFINMEFKAHYLKIFILWLMFFIVYRLFGLFPGHVILKTGIYHVLDWLYIGKVYGIIASGISAIIFIFIGFQILRGIIVLSGTYHFHIRDMGIPNLIFASILNPLILVSVVSFLFYLPDIPEEEILGLILVIMLNTYIFIAMYFMDPNLFSFKEKVIEKNKPEWILTLTLIAVLFLRLILDVNITGI